MTEIPVIWEPGPACNTFETHRTDPSGDMWRCSTCFADIVCHNTGHPRLANNGLERDGVTLRQVCGAAATLVCEHRDCFLSVCLAEAACLGSHVLRHRHDVGRCRRRWLAVRRLAASGRARRSSSHSAQLRPSGLVLCLFARAYTALTSNKHTHTHLQNTPAAKGCRATCDRTPQHSLHRFSRGTRVGFE